MNIQDQIKNKKTELDLIIEKMSVVPKTMVTKAQKQEIDNIELRKEFRLTELRDECYLRELQIKIDIYKSLLGVIKK